MANVFAEAPEPIARAAGQTLWKQPCVHTRRSEQRRSCDPHVRRELHYALVSLIIQLTDLHQRLSCDVAHAGAAAADAAPAGKHQPPGVPAPEGPQCVTTKAEAPSSLNVHHGLLLSNPCDKLVAAILRSQVSFGRFRDVQQRRQSIMFFDGLS